MQAGGLEDGGEGDEGAGKEACPTCCKAAGSDVYCTKNGEKYHLDKACSGMTNAMEVTLAEAMVMGKKRCDVCIKNGALPTASQLAKQAEENSLGDAGVETTHYWLYAPGEGAARRDEFYDRGVMALAWSKIGDLSAYETKEDLRQALLVQYSDKTSQKNS